MRNYTFRLAVTVAALVIPGVVLAQHDAHQPAASPTQSPELAQCVQAQPAIHNIIAAAMSRAEAARLSNSPTEMRAAVEHLEAALRDIRTQSAPCSTAAASIDPHAGHSMPMPPQAATPGQLPPNPVDPHAGHTMPMNQPPASSRPAQPPTSAADPHAGHAMPAPPAASSGSIPPKPVTKRAAKPAAADPHAGHAMSSGAPAGKSAPASKPAAAQPAETGSTDPHAGHATSETTDKQRDPVTGLMVDTATAPKTTYQNQTFYFSSEQSRKEFLDNPAKFAKKP